MFNHSPLVTAPHFISSHLQLPHRPFPRAIAATATAMAAAASCSHPPFSPAASLHHRPHGARRCGFSPLPWPPPPPPRALLWRRPRRLAPTTFCSAPSLPRLGRVGWPRREGNAWLLSFRGDTAAAPDPALGDPSKALSALLPLVVAAPPSRRSGTPPPSPGTAPCRFKKVLGQLAHGG